MPSPLGTLGPFYELEHGKKETVVGPPTPGAAQVNKIFSPLPPSDDPGVVLPMAILQQSAGADFSYGG